MNRRFAVACFLLVVLAIFLFFSLIAHLEPIGNDGWDLVEKIKSNSDNRPGLGHLIEDMAWRYENRNPRISEIFTVVNYYPYPIHEFLTPLMIVLLFFCIFVTALGRIPDPTRLHDTSLLIVTMALCWLSIPDVGVAYFSRPIAGNYTISACLQLLLFIPLRLRITTPERPPLKVVAAGLMLVGGFVAGMANEHTGPVAIVAFGALAVHWARKGGTRLPAWAVTGWIGLVAGYLVLFLAPGQKRRYHGLGSETGLFENVVGRGWGGNLEVVWNFLVMALPLLVVVTVVGYSVVVADRESAGGLAENHVRRRFLEIGLIVACAAGIVGTVLASPLIGPRLFIAPMILLIMSVLVFVDVVGREKRLRMFFAVSAVVINLVFATHIYRVYRAVHTEYLERFEILTNAPPGSVARVPFYTRKFRDRFFIGDDFTRKYPRARAAAYFDLGGIETYQHPERVPNRRRDRRR